LVAKNTQPITRVNPVAIIATEVRATGRVMNRPFSARAPDAISAPTATTPTIKVRRPKIGNSVPGFLGSRPAKAPSPSRMAWS
jgi:hypothetical protein